MEKDPQQVEPGKSFGRPRSVHTEACPSIEDLGSLEECGRSLNPQRENTERYQEEDAANIQHSSSGSVEVGSSSVSGTDELAVSEDSERPVKTSSSGKTVRFQIPQDIEAIATSESSEESLFPDYDLEEWTTSNDHLLRKKVLEQGPEPSSRPTWGQEVTLRLQGVLEDRTVVEKDSKLVFVIGEGDVNLALEHCAASMCLWEIALLLADSQYTYGHQGRDPDIPAWSPLLYELQLLDIRDKPDPLTLSIPDRIRIGNQKRERGNFYFQREEYSMAAKAYCMALDVLTTKSRGDVFVEEEEEVQEYRVKCLNNLAAVQLKMEQFDEALHTSKDVLLLDPLNVKALFRKGKVMTLNKGEYDEAMETLKKALKLEPSTKVRYTDLIASSSLIFSLLACLRLL
uniref:peptidylprolyl isomerase n=1 Tax=Scleropages formosus TaxID=113540 RepID=A0A8C9S6E7_SCLFO